MFKLPPSFGKFILALLLIGCILLEPACAPHTHFTASSGLPSAAPSVLPSISPTPTSVPTPKPMHFSIEECVIDSEKGLYDVTQILLKDRERYCAAAYQEDGSILALTLSLDGKNCCVDRIDLQNGCRTLLTRFYWQGENAPLPDQVQILSCEPIVLLDTAQTTLYTLSANSREMQALSFSEEALTQWYVAAGEIYAFHAQKGVLYRVNPNKPEAPLSAVYALDYRYRYATMLSLAEDARYATFTGINAYSQENELVTFAVDLSTADLLWEQAGRAFLSADGRTVASITETWDDDKITTCVNSSRFSVSPEDAEEGGAMVYSAYVSDFVVPPRYGFLFGVNGDEYQIVTLSSTGEFASVSISLSNSGLSGISALSYPDMFSASCDKNGNVLLPIGEYEGAYCLLYWMPQESQRVRASAAEAPSQSPTHTADQQKETDALAMKIENQYGVSILCGKNALLTLPDYQLTACEDEETIEDALETLDKVLAEYPEAFFSSLCGDRLRGIVFLLTGPMAPTTDAGIMDPNGLACEIDSYHLIAVNTEYFYTIASTVYHEIGHVIDSQLGYLNPENGEKWSENRWNALNPDGFQYYQAYLDEKGNSLANTGSLENTPYSEEYAETRDVETVYFLDAYAKTFPTEDRAMLIAAAMEDGEMPRFMKSSHIQAKLRYFFETIRLYLDPDGNWKEQTKWEAALDALETK